MSKTKPPAQIRVTFQYKHWETDDETGVRSYPEPPLGFAIAYTPEDKKWSSDKHRVQDEWAYSFFHKWRYDGENFIVAVEHRWGKQPNGKYEHVYLPEAPILPELQPRILDNVPQTGFKLMKSVTRYSTSNKLWRVLDPRGFMLEISTQNLEDILLEGKIEKGLIDGSFVWQPGRTVKLVRV